MMGLLRFGGFWGREPRVAYLAMNRILVVGVPRSGSTWLASMLAATPGSFAVLEPDNPYWHPEAEPVRKLLGTYAVLGPGERAPEYQSLWDGVFSGIPRGARRWPRPEVHNVVAKSVFAAFAVEWLAERYAPRVILIERNPLNVVASWMQHHFEVGDLATRERIRDSIEPLALPEWDPFAPRVLQVAWAVGVLMSVMRRQARTHPEWALVSHDALCVEPARGLRTVAQAAGLRWTARVERRVRGSNAPGTGAEIKRVAGNLPSKWRRVAGMEDVAPYLAQFADLLHWPEVGAAAAAEKAGSVLEPGGGAGGSGSENGVAADHATLLEILDQVQDASSAEAPAPEKRGSDLRYLAFYLPQFHPIPENDSWWGSGFTEWVNVKRATPRFPGHHQPQLPAEELGFYDLRDPEARALQAALAQTHGIDGFVYYHYWFLGRRLLGRPLDEVLETGQPNFPFCLCWANENWTRTWDGGNRSVLLEQRYSPEDDLEHIRWLARPFADPRYVRVAGRPLVLVYRASRLPDAPRTAETWRREAIRLGVGEPYLCSVQSFPSERVDPATLGFDAAVEFPAGLAGWHDMGRVLRLDEAEPRPVGTAGDGSGKVTRIYSYPVASELALRRPRATYKRYPCVAPGWDNSPRDPVQVAVFVGSSPAVYGRWLAKVSEAFAPYSTEENLVFVNAWNEWGESNHLEPDRFWGDGFLEAHLRATGRAAG